jgi:Mlc titration factor MtfA (ptsG expression regulator)
MLSWVRNRRRKKILAEPFPPEWREAIDQNVSFYGMLDGPERAKLEDDLRLFMAEKSWEACGGLRLTDTKRASISAQACLLVLNRSLRDYDHVENILVYPEAYFVHNRRVDPSGIVTESLDGRSGEAWTRGTVVLSWADAREGGRRGDDGRNVVFHEFAHQLDMADHVVDGTPILDSRKEYDRWVEVMTAEFERLEAMAEQGHPSVLDAYGATNEAEFFAVATEAFFERSLELRANHPELYDLLLDFYRQDPAARRNRRRQ